MDPSSLLSSTQGLLLKREVPRTNILLRDTARDPERTKKRYLSRMGSQPEQDPVHLARSRN